jgi:hypothetical protein
VNPFGLAVLGLGAVVFVGVFMWLMRTKPDLRHGSGGDGGLDGGGDGGDGGGD